MLTNAQMKEYRALRAGACGGIHTARHALACARRPAAPDYAPDTSLELEIDGVPCVAWLLQDYDEASDISWLGEVDRHGVTPAITEDAHYRELCKLKYGRRESRELAQAYFKQDLARLEAYQRGDWHMCCLGVRIADDEGRELATAYLGGVESDASAGYLGETYAELLEEARSEAIDSIARTRKKYLTMSKE